MEDYHFPAHAPEALRKAARDLPTFKQHVKTLNDQELSVALDLIYMHHEVHRTIIKDEISARQQAASKTRSEDAFDQTERHHSQRQRWTRYAVGVAILSALAAWASFFASSSRLARFEERLTAIEQRLDTIAPLTTPAKPQQYRSLSTPLPTPSTASVASTPVPQATSLPANTP